MTTRADIDDFLQQKRIAMVGVSRNPKDFSRGLFREFLQRGYDIIPVNPNAAEVEGKSCVARLQDIAPAPDAVLLMTPPHLTDTVVQECAQAGIRRVWMYSAGGHGAMSQDAVAFCSQNGIRVVEGHCPYMFFPKVGFFPHRMHGFFLKLAGKYPAMPKA